MSKNNPETSSSRRTFYKPMPEAKVKDLSKTISTNLSTSFSHRSSMLPSEFLQPQTLTRKKKYAASRHSILPAQLALESTKEAETRSKGEELQLLYNDYLQVIMLEHVTKKKSEEMKNAIIKQLITISKQCAQDEEKLHKLKIRKGDIINLIMVQEELDTHTNKIKGYCGNNKISTVKEIISHLCSILEPLDQLQCNDIILPEKTEEWLELREALKECEDVLGRIRELINTNVETYQALHDGIKDFVSVYNDMQSYQQKFDKALYNMQVLTLKYGAFTLK